MLATRDVHLCYQEHARLLAQSLHAANKQQMERVDVKELRCAEFVVCSVLAMFLKGENDQRNGNFAKGSPKA